MQCKHLLILVVTALVGGCATSAVDEQHGQAVGQMLDGQVYDRSTLYNPRDRAVEGVDPDAAAAAVDAMRKDTADRAAVHRSGGGAGSNQAGNGSQ